MFLKWPKVVQGIQRIKILRRKKWWNPTPRCFSPKLGAKGWLNLYGEWIQKCRNTKSANRIWNSNYKNCVMRSIVILSPTRTDGSEERVGRRNWPIAIESERLHWVELANWYAEASEPFGRVTSRSQSAECWCGRCFQQKSWHQHPVFGGPNACHKSRGDGKQSLGLWQLADSQGCIWLVLQRGSECKDIVVAFTSTL